MSEYIYWPALIPTALMALIYFGLWIAEERGRNK